MKAHLKYIDAEIEELVIMTVNGLDVICFAGVCPYEIQVGKDYSVHFQVVVLNDYNVSMTTQKDAGMEKVGNAFKYVLRGKLRGGTIECGLPFEDETLLSDYGVFEGSMVELIVDRIDVEFL